ncbi:hypothetical protein Q4519_21805, partial [Motilimonas sp. 1_MG-2023]|uniref:hypothetical protein n=1 Tax=Motilimonas sp. 1_MG-2023 TaxID=3062672 RepID=UPI0026E445F5
SIFEGFVVEKCFILLGSLVFDLFIFECFFFNGCYFFFDILNFFFLFLWVEVGYIGSFSCFDFNIVSVFFLSCCGLCVAP